MLLYSIKTVVSHLKCEEYWSRWKEDDRYFGRQNEKGTQESNKEIDSPEEQDGPLHDLGNQPSTSLQQNRVLSTSGNWEKVREKLLNSHIEEQQLPDNVICINCQQGIATTRCEYCGPRQYFCVGCARALHGSRNKFHVLEQWKVSMNVINVFLPVAFKLNLILATF